MKQVTDTVAIEKAVAEIISANPDQVEKAKLNPKLIGWFVGQIVSAILLFRRFTTQQTVKPLTEGIASRDDRLTVTTMIPFSICSSFWRKTKQPLRIRTYLWDQWRVVEMAHPVVAL